MGLAGTQKGERQFVDGNRAAAWGVRLCRPDFITAYPITPGTPVLEQLCQFEADGLLDADVVMVEGEHSAMCAVIGAASAGARTFTSTSANGLAFMFEPYFLAAARRLPIVMTIVTREPQFAVVGGQQDIITQKDAGWVIIFAESCQEIIDSIIMAYKLAEDPTVRLPVNICIDGYYLSHLSEEVEVPPQELVDSFLGPPPDYLRLDPERPITIGSHTVPPELFAEFRYKHCAAFERVRAKIDQVDKDFQTTFGRSYGGQIEEYRNDDAEVTLLTMGSCTGVARVVVDRKREQGKKVGLIKVRAFRPFPKDRLIAALRGKKVAAVMDRQICFSAGCGHLFLELKSALYDSISMPLVNFIDGLGGGDITEDHIETALGITLDISKGRAYPEVTWLQLEEF
jgi:pyruvate/2-oxoacid:ferredoxin oxidoreductase alpha subunit